MELNRRRFLCLTTAAVALPSAARAGGPAYPAHPVRFIVPQAAGSSSDITARLLAQWLSDHLGQPFLVDPRPGVGGNIATEAVVRSAADGYTLLLVNSQNAISPALYTTLTFNFMRDIAPVAQVDLVPLVMEVNPSLPVKTVPEFIAYAKANPGKINMASAGVGGPQHVAGELFKSMAGINMVHVPYRGSTPAVTDLLAGQVQMMFDVLPTALPQIRAGKLRALAVTTKEPLDVLPGIPPVAAFLPGYEAVAWIGVGVPTGTPAAIIQTLNEQIRAGLADDRIKARLADLGGIVKTGSAADFGNFIAAETDKWGKVIRTAGIKPD